MSFEDIFDNREKKSYVRARKYDVKITLNKNGHDRFSVRFGFLNDAAKAFASYDYIQFSNVEKLPGKIYFKLYEDRRYLDCYKLCLNGKKSGYRLTHKQLLDNANIELKLKKEPK